MSTEHSYWELLDPYFEKIDIYEGPDVFLKSISGVPAYAVLLYSIHMCSSEIHNGGFLQLFWNSTGLIVPDAIQGFRAVGMNSIADLVAQAANLLGPDYPKDRKDRRDALITASGMEAQVTEKLFSDQMNLFTALRQATEALGFGAMDRAFWKLAAAENGGLEIAATRFAQQFHTQTAYRLFS